MVQFLQGGRHRMPVMQERDDRRLSEKESTIVRLVAQAKCRKTIARELNISIRTVDTHLRHIHLKTNTHSLPELVVWKINTNS